MKLILSGAMVVLTVSGSVLGQSAKGDKALEQKIRGFEQEEVAARDPNRLALAPDD